MRSVFGLLSVFGIIFLAACSRTAPPEVPKPIAAITSAADPDFQASAEPSVEEPADSEPVMEGNAGLATGQKAPAFKLKDQTGTERTLDEYLENGKVALVFYRSADW